MDAGALANSLRRPAIAGESTAVDRITLSVKLAITVASAHGGRAELARELQALAGRYPVIRLVQSPGAPARLEAGPMRLPIPASLRDALLAAVRAPQASALPRAAAAAVSTAAGAPAAATLAASAPGSASLNASAQVAATPAPAGAATPPLAAGSGAPAMTAAAMPVSPLAVAALASASLRAAAQWPAMLLAVQSMPSRLQTAAAGRSRPRLDLPLSAPLLDEATDAAAVAARLAGAVRASGLFTEAQLARTLAGAGDPRATEAAVSGEAARVPVELPLAERTAAQLDVLRRDAAAFLLSPWAGQRARLDLGREPVDAEASPGAADAARVFFATLQLDLPQLGAVTVRLRLLNATIAASVEAAEPGPWQAALPELAAQLGARGLQAAAVVATRTQPGDSDATGA